MPESGTYVVKVTASDLTNTGSYAIGLECIVPPSPDAVALSCGSRVDGTITAGAEADLFTFTGTAGEVVALLLSETVAFTGNQAPFATVFSPTGVEVTSFFPAQREITLPESGTYVVKVTASDLTNTGSYAIGLECIVPPSPDAVALSCGSRVDGTITAGPRRISSPLPGRRARWSHSC